MTLLTGSVRQRYGLPYGMAPHEGLVREKAVCRTKRYGNGEDHGLLDLLVAAINGFEALKANGGLSLIATATIINSTC